MPGSSAEAACCGADTEPVDAVARGGEVLAVVDSPRDAVPEELQAEASRARTTVDTAAATPIRRERMGYVLSARARTADDWLRRIL